MSPSTFRNAAALGLALVLAAAGVVTADTVVADGDAVTAGNQTLVDLGDVAPGATVPVDVAFRLSCKLTSHVTAGSTITVSVTDQTWPEDGSATSTPGVITVPADWPASGTSCPDSGVPTTLGETPAHLVLTAPTLLGTGFEFTFLFAADPATGVSNTIAFTARLNVAAPAAPADTTPPTLAGVPADMTVFTSGSDAVVAYPLPTATDDTDPSPVVACDPASGSTFALGTTTVTCTATDATGNQSQATFAVTVRRLAATWGAPLNGSATPALIGQVGRTIPLKLFVTGGDATVTTLQASAPALVLEQLSSASTSASVLSSRSAGTFWWDDGAWHLNLRTSGLAAGAWRLTATLDGAPLASTVILLVQERGSKPGPVALLHRRSR